MTKDNVSTTYCVWKSKRWRKPTTKKNQERSYTQPNLSWTKYTPPRTNLQNEFVFETSFRFGWRIKVYKLINYRHDPSMPRKREKFSNADDEKRRAETNWKFFGMTCAVRAFEAVHLFELGALPFKEKREREKKSRWPLNPCNDYVFLIVIRVRFWTGGWVGGAEAKEDWLQGGDGRKLEGLPWSNKFPPPTPPKLAKVHSVFRDWNLHLHYTRRKRFDGYF